MSNSRENKSTSAEIDKSVLFGSGTFKNVYQGKYTEGERIGQKCVAKEFKTGSVYEEYYFDEEMNIIHHTQKVIDDWHNAGIINLRIFLNTPEVWVYRKTRAYHLVEPMIENFEKFNSNSGWVDTSGGVWSQSMQALSHFSYHNSGGQLLLCDLQGGSFRDGYILSDPVIMSQSQNWGPADLGPEGIRSFFQRHQCGPFCRGHWMRPQGQGAATIPLRKGTSMVRELPMRSSRNPLTRLQE